MKKAAYSMMLCLFFFSCKIQNTRQSAEKMHEPFIYVFKMTYFKKLLTEGFDRSPSIKEILQRDGSDYGEPILQQEDYSLIDSLVKIDNETMKQDSVKRVGRVSEGFQGKHVFNYTLSKYQSRWLDSLAETRYKAFIVNHD
jgi:hypothetical protein